MTGFQLSIAYADGRVLVVTIYGKRNARYDIIRFVGMDHLRLTEEDVPGAKVTTSPSKCKAALLHRWLSCRGVTHSGLRKAELVERYTSYSVVLVVFTLCSCTSADRVKSVIKSGEERNVIDPDGGVHERRKLEELQKAGQPRTQHVVGMKETVVTRQTHTRKMDGYASEGVSNTIYGYYQSTLSGKGSIDKY